MKRCDFKSDAFSCAEEAISAYIDGELSKDESAAIEEHIKNCPKCAETLARYRSFKAEIEKMKFDVPDDLHERIMSGIKERIKTESAPDTKKPKILSPTLSRRIGLWCGAGIAAVLCLSMIASPLFKKAFSLDDKSIEYAVGDADMVNYSCLMKNPSESDYNDKTEFGGLNETVKYENNAAGDSESGVPNNDMDNNDNDGADVGECAEAKGIYGGIDIAWFEDKENGDAYAPDDGLDLPMSTQAPEYFLDGLKFSMINSSLRYACYNDLCLNILEYPETTAHKTPEYEHSRGTLD